MKKAKIFITDDDRDDYELIVSVFADLGFEHDFVYLENGGRLIDLLESMVKNKTKLPDLIILDLNMPKVDGLTTLGIIRSKKYLASVPVLIYTTTNCCQQKEACYSLGADGFATKECSVKKIANFVTRLHAFLNNEGRLPGEKSKVDMLKTKISLK